jgi:hypothetical protein
MAYSLLHNKQLVYYDGDHEDVKDLLDADKKQLKLGSKQMLDKSHCHKDKDRQFIFREIEKNFADSTDAIDTIKAFIETRILNERNSNATKKSGFVGILSGISDGLNEGKFKILSTMKVETGQTEKTSSRRAPGSMRIKKPQVHPEKSRGGAMGPKRLPPLARSKSARTVS